MMLMINAADRDLPQKYTSSGGCLDVRSVNELPWLARLESWSRVGEE
jgi:hypothetical protein